MFNEFGVPNQEILDFGNKIFSQVQARLETCTTMTDIRAVAQYLSSVIDVAASELILVRTLKLTKEKRNADKLREIGATIPNQPIHLVK
jgi:hypothetical protein